MTETLIIFVLQRLDQIESPVFLHRELERFPEKELKALLSEGILRETSRATKIPRPKHLTPGGDLFVRKTSIGLFGVADDDDYFDPIPLTEDDVRQYDISPRKLVDSIRLQNEISGSGFENYDGLIPLGQKRFDSLGILNAFMSIQNWDEKTFLSRCQRLERYPGSKKVVVLTPRGIALSPEGRRILDSSGIMVVAMESALNQGDLKMDWATISVDPKKVILLSGWRRIKCFIKSINEWEEFIFNGVQSKVIEVLYDAPDYKLHICTVFKKIERDAQEQYRMDKIFKHHSNWRLLLKPDLEKRGFWFLDI